MADDAVKSCACGGSGRLSTYTIDGERHADRLYLDLKGARERLCRAQMAVPAHWRSDLQAALDHIDMTGSAVCPEQWSRFDQPVEATDD